MAYICWRNVTVCDIAESASQDTCGNKIEVVKGLGSLTYSRRACDWRMKLRCQGQVTYII